IEEGGTIRSHLQHACEHRIRYLGEAVLSEIRPEGGLAFCLPPGHAPAPSRHLSSILVQRAADANACRHAQEYSTMRRLMNPSHSSVPMKCRIGLAGRCGTPVGKPPGSPRSPRLPTTLVGTCLRPFQPTSWRICERTFTSGIGIVS